MADKKLAVGGQIWIRLSGRESSFIAHFYESYLVLSSTESAEDSGNSAYWVRVSLISVRGQPEVEKNLKNRVKLKEIEEGAEQIFEGGSMRPEAQFHILWNCLAVSILIRATCSS
jgi:hypothetical protein